MLIDTHCHLDEAAFDADRAEVVQSAVASGLEAMLTIGINEETSVAAARLAAENESVFAVVGVQPNYVSDADEQTKEVIQELLGQPKVVAIGETGLDYYWDHAPAESQRVWFDWHLRLAAETGLPFVVHCRDAEDEVVEQLRRFAAGATLRGVMHSFCGSRATAAACLELGLHLSFSGMLTYRKNEALREVAKSVPIERLLVETDAPYLAPVPKRGKRNEPAYVAYTAAVLADVLGMSESDLAAATTANARALFSLPTTAAPAVLA